MGNIQKEFIQHLEGQFQRATPVLFTGAGFSLGVKNITGQPFPSVSDLKKVLWALAFPSDPYDEVSSLQDLYDTCLLRHIKELKEKLTQQLTVDPNSVPEWYQPFFAMPWSKVYTLNIDNVAGAVSTKFSVPRKLKMLSALEPFTTLGSSELHSLELIHLNGEVEGLTDRVTFSTTQYADRVARADPWYSKFVTDFLTRPFVIVGTRLEEAPLWQHIELRRPRGGRSIRELRPRSYLVTPHLDKSKEARLADFNIHWIPLTAEQFSKELTDNFKESAKKGLVHIESLVAQAIDETKIIPEVATLSNSPIIKTEFLVGEEPRWADIQSGRAIERESDDTIWAKIKSLMASKEVKGVFVFTGTAASGKSTSLMRTCLRLVAEGHHVGWIDREKNISPRVIRETFFGENPPSVLAIDDADLYGGQLSLIINSIADSPKKPLILVAMGSSKVDRHLNRDVLKNVPISEETIPHLSDSDIGELIDVLDKDNRLGKLKGKTRAEQEKSFRDNAGRQLIVAMMEATSGEKFEEKAYRELEELQEPAKRIYAIIATATAFRFSLTKDDILLATGNGTNEELNALDTLVTRKIVFGIGDGKIRARHTKIAEIVRDELAKNGLLGDVLSGLALMGAAKVNPVMDRKSKPWKFLRAIISHEFLHKFLPVETARNLYGLIEQPLNWEPHYWLQRGALEVELGDLGLAQNFLSQARSMSPDNHWIENEWAYLLFKQALITPGSMKSQELVNEAVDTLIDLINKELGRDPYPFHILGTQGILWARNGLKQKEEKRKFLQEIFSTVKSGLDKSPSNIDLQRLRDNLQKELLQLAV